MVRMVVVVAHCRQSMNNVLVIPPPPPPFVMAYLVDQCEFVIVEQSIDSHMQLQRHLSKHRNDGDKEGDGGDGDDNDEEDDGGDGY